jgi:hypothetical protein
MGETKQKLVEKGIELVFDIGKAVIYGFLLLLFIRVVKSDVGKYIEEYEKVKAVQEASLQFHNEQVDAARRLARSARMLEYNARACDIGLAAVSVTKLSFSEFRSTATQFSSDLRLYLSYASDLDATRIGAEVDTKVHDLMSVFDEPGSAKRIDYLRRNLIILESQLAALTTNLTSAEVQHYSE